MSLQPSEKVLAITGGVGGAKLALGLSQILPPESLNIVANTGDDFWHLGLKICPDLDTVMYTLSDLSNKTLGWGQEGETWEFLSALERLGGETWFRLGDRDMATHIRRTQLLTEGATLSEATTELARALGIPHALIPMTDSEVATQVMTTTGETLAFQHYFVRDQCKPEVRGFEFSGIGEAAPSPQFDAALADPALGMILICPSNPFVSVDPVLHLPGVSAAMQNGKAPIVAVSPIVAGIAIKGPAAKMMAELGMPQTALAVAEHYAGRIDALVIDSADEALAKDIESLGIKVFVTPTVMKSLEDKTKLAGDCISFLETLR